MSINKSDYYAATYINSNSHSIHVKLRISNKREGLLIATKWLFGTLETGVLPLNAHFSLCGQLETATCSKEGTFAWKAGNVINNEYGRANQTLRNDPSQSCVANNKISYTLIRVCIHEVNVNNFEIYSAAVLICSWYPGR